MDDVIQNFVEELIKKAGIDNMPEDFKKEQLVNLKAQVEQRLGMMAISDLDEAGVTAFEEFMIKNKTPNSKLMLEFFNTHISDFENKVQDTLTKFGQEFVQGVENLKGTKLS
jgi:hypothetical protein